MVIVEKNKQGITIPNPRGNQIKYSPTASKEYVDNKVAEEQQRAELAEYVIQAEISNVEAELITKVSQSDMPVSKGEHNNSLIQKYNGNQATGYASVALGHGTKATRDRAYAEGNFTESNGDGAHSEGERTKANGNSSHAEGVRTQTTNYGEHAEGIWNKSNTNTISSIGVGNSDSERLNAIEVQRNGDVYVKGLGDYDGSNPTNSKSLKDVIDEKISSTEAYDNFVDFSTEQSIQATKTFKSGINMSNTRIRNLREPNNATDAANKAYVDSVKTDVDNIKDVIPSQASSTNQLADKEFVNSSIATNTANFIGTFNSINELPTTGVTNNDYAFVVTNNVYSRYKWNETSWLFEYELNNSSFTQEQWETINAGLTSGDTENLRDVVELVSDVVPEDASSTNKLVSTKFLEDRHVILPLLSSEATQEELEGVYNAISNAPQGSAFFISLPEGRGVMPVAIAIGGASVFAQYSDGRYSHELKITLDEGEYLFDKTDVEMADFNMAIDAANEAIDDALDEYAGGAIIGAIKNYHDDSKQDTLTAGSGITIQNNVISATGGGGSNWEKLCDYTTTGITVQIVWNSGDNGQVFNDYNELVIIMLLQPAPGTERRISLNVNGSSAWLGGYLIMGAEKLRVPASTDKSGLAICELKKHPVLGIQQEVSVSYNNGSVSSLIMSNPNPNYGVRAVNITSNVINPPSVLDNPPFEMEFGIISLGGYTQVLSPDCRFQIFGKK